MRALLSVLVFVCAFAINPAYVMGCGSDDSGDADFKFTGDEMLALSERAKGSYPFSVGGQAYVVTLDAAVQPMARGPSLFGSPAYACGSRQIFATASACVDSSEAPLKGTATLERVASDDSREVLLADVPVEGSFVIFGLSLTNGFVELTSPTLRLALNSDGQSFTLYALYASELGEAGEELDYESED